jgi:hypothetical protein
LLFIHDSKQENSTFKCEGGWRLWRQTAGGWRLVAAFLDLLDGLSLIQHLSIFFFIPSSSSLSQPPAASLVFGDFGHRTPKPSTTFPSHQQPFFLSSSSFSHTPRHH